MAGAGLTQRFVASFSELLYQTAQLPFMHACIDRLLLLLKKQNIAS